MLHRINFGYRSIAIYSKISVFQHLASSECAPIYVVNYNLSNHQ